MLPKQEVVAALLAGRQGSRLGVLAKNPAKPTVSYDGKYRVIDSPPSNYANLGIEAVGVLTQYQPLVLSDYIDSSQFWDLDSMDAGVYMLALYQHGRKADWCKGAADAAYQNIPFIGRYHPGYTMILSGDYVYKMDYSKMTAYHEKKETDCTIVQIRVPWEEAPHFGILNTREGGSIYEFDEKPKKPKSNKVSMGIYVFSRGRLRKYLEQDEADSKSSNGLGGDLFPAMLETGERIFAYEFSSYWKDVRTIESLWESNMDLLDPHTEFDLDEPSQKIYSHNPVMPSHYLASEAMTQNSPITEGCNVYGEVDSTVLFVGTYIAPGAVVCGSIIMLGNRVGEGAVVQYVIVPENVVTGKGTVVGTRPGEVDDKSKWGVVVVGENCAIASGTVAPTKAVIDAEEVVK